MDNFEKSFQSWMEAIMQVLIPFEYITLHHQYI